MLTTEPFLLRLQEKDRRMKFALALALFGTAPMASAEEFACIIPSQIGLGTSGDVDSLSLHEEVQQWADLNAATIRSLFRLRMEEPGSLVIERNDVAKKWDQLPETAPEAIALGRQMHEDPLLDHVTTFKLSDESGPRKLLKLGKPKESAIRLELQVTEYAETSLGAAAAMTTSYTCLAEDAVANAPIDPPPGVRCQSAMSRRNQAQVHICRMAP